MKANIIKKFIDDNDLMFTREEKLELIESATWVLPDEFKGNVIEDAENAIVHYETMPNEDKYKDILLNVIMIILLDKNKQITKDEAYDRIIREIWLKW